MWDKNDWYAAALIGVLLVAGLVIGVYGLSIMEEPKTIKSYPVYPTNLTEPEILGDSEQNNSLGGEIYAKEK